MINCSTNGPGTKENYREKITNEIRKLIVNDSQIVYKIEEEGCQLIVSEDFKPCFDTKI